MVRRTSLSLLLIVGLGFVVACSPPPDDGDTTIELVDTAEGDSEEPDGTDGDTDTADTGVSDAGDTAEEDTSDGDDEDTVEGDTGGGDVPPNDTGGADANDAGDAEDTSRDCTIDSDSDGLTDCEEERMCTDPHDGDSDGDKLSDLEELQNQTDPCSEDTDGDGATDKEELDFGLDPNRPSTFDDGVPDGDRWRLKACDNPQAEPVDFYKNTTGNWTLALPPAFDNYTELNISNASAPVASALYDDPATEVAGATLSKEAEALQSSPTDPLRNEVQSAIDGVGNVIQDQTGGEFETHDEKTAAVGHYLIESSSSVSVRKVREELLTELAPFSKSDATGFPNTAGANYKTFRVFVSVIFRTRQGARDQSLISISVSPDQKYTNLDKVKFRMDDLTNTTNIAEQVDSHLVKCATFTPGEETPKAEFYWVLDQSGSMSDDNQKVADFADQFESKVKNTALDYRMGVTNMDKDNDGHLRVPPAWHTDPNTFKKEVEEAVIGCSRGGSWKCSGGAEHGLESAKSGIKYMTGQASATPTAAERIRSNAQVITIFMSDEEDNTFKRNYSSEREYNQLMQPFSDFFPGRTIAFAIVGDGEGCGVDDGRAFKDVALETGGKFASLCAKDLTQTIQDIIFAASGLASNYVLPQAPISSSLRVFINGTWVPRSREDGFEYFEENNSIAFFGSFRPDPPEENDSGPKDFIAVSYETFKDRCKQTGSGSCSPSSN